jgi:peptidylprolyl isomerase
VAALTSGQNCMIFLSITRHLCQLCKIFLQSQSKSASPIWAGKNGDESLKAAANLARRTLFMAETLTLTVDTGDIVIKLRPDLAPGHVERISTLASEGFYDGVVFHRVIDGFMAQGGDPTGTGMGGSEKPNIAAEFSREPHVRGVCSMARSSNPNSANSQFFICLDDARFLDGQYTVWGEVTSGMEHVDALPKGEPPRAPGKIVKASVA